MNALTNAFRTSVRISALPTRPTVLPSTRGFSTSFPSRADSSTSSGAEQLNDVIKGIKEQTAKRPHRSSQPRQSVHSIYPELSSSPSHRSSSRGPHAHNKPATPEERWTYASPVQYSPSVTTTSARSFAVQQGNVARAYRNLNRVLNENQVRRELKRQERFESPSNKRVRLNSERHRRRFKVAVGKAVSLAMRMKDL